MSLLKFVRYRLTGEMGWGMPLSIINVTNVLYFKKRKRLFRVLHRDRPWSMDIVYGQAGIHAQTISVRYKTESDLDIEMHKIENMQKKFGSI